MSRNNQRKRKQAEWDLGRLPTRGEMIKQLEWMLKLWQSKTVQLQMAAVCQLKMCSRKDWDVEYVRMYECTVQKVRYAQNYMGLLEQDLSELYSGATKGWPLRGEVIYSAR